MPKQEVSVIRRGSRVDLVYKDFELCETCQTVWISQNTLGRSLCHARSIHLTYRLDGTKVSQAEARKLLEKMGPVFLLRGFAGDIKAVEGVYLQALNPNCLIVVTETTE